MKPVFFLALLFVYSPITLASNLAEKVQETYKKTRQFRAGFVQKTKIDVLDREVEEQGELIFSKTEAGTGRFFIHYLGRREREYISNGQTLWIYRPHDKEVEVYKKLNEIISREALVFLGGLGEMKKEFIVTEEGQGRLLLIPQKKEALFRRLVLQINPKTYLVQEAVLFPKSGNKSHYQFVDIHVNEPMPESTFEFHEKQIKIITPY